MVITNVTPEAKTKRISIGFIGFSQQDFNKEHAQRLIAFALSTYTALYGRKAFEVVSGLTNLGIPAIVYEEAKKRGIYTVGIACEKANDFELFPVDETIIVGKEWGDESSAFLDRIDKLVKCGGGEQSEAEKQKFIDTKGKKNFVELALPKITPQ